jgi:predicted  nucleic acid-binding Zn-ribbon protein
MQGQILMIICTILFSAIVGLIGFWLRVAHKEIKEAIKQLTNYIYELNKAVMVLETHINKGIEQGISSNKERLVEMNERLEKLESEYKRLTQILSPQK